MRLLSKITIGVFVVTIFTANYASAQIINPQIRHLAVLFELSDQTIETVGDWIDMPGMSAQIQVGGLANRCVTVFFEVRNESGSDWNLQALLDTTEMNGSGEFFTIPTSNTVQNRQFSLCNVSAGSHQIRLRVGTLSIGQTIFTKARSLIILGP